MYDNNLELEEVWLAKWDRHRETPLVICKILMYVSKCAKIFQNVMFDRSIIQSCDFHCTIPRVKQI